jgi:hypothetical protein
VLLLPRGDSGLPNPEGWQKVAGGRFGLLAKRPPVIYPIASAPRQGRQNHKVCSTHHIPNIF